MKRKLVLWIGIVASVFSEEYTTETIVEMERKILAEMEEIRGNFEEQFSNDITKMTGILQKANDDLKVAEERIAEKRSALADEIDNIEIQERETIESEVYQQVFEDSERLFEE